MAFNLTMLQEGILNFSQVAGLQMGQNETRKSRYGALQCVKDSTSALVPEATLRALKECSSQANSIDVLVKQAPGVDTTRACCKGAPLTSANVPFTFQGFCEGFEISTHEHCGNRISEQTAYNHGVSEVLRNLYTRIDAAAVAHLEATKSDGVALTYGATVAGAHQVSLAERPDYFNQAITDMAINDYYGAFANVASTSQTGLIRTDEFNAGKDCCTDGSPFAEGAFNHCTSNRVVNNAGVTSTSYLFEKGQVGMIPWINQISRMGKDIGAERWDSIVDPMFGLPIEVKICHECKDNSGIYGAGAENDLVTKYAFYVDIAFLNAYSSDANTGIYKYELLAV